MKIPLITLNNKQKIPNLGLGTWQMQGETVYYSVLNALKIGYTHIDTAEIYYNQEEIGNAIKDSKIDRKKLFITSKIWHQDLHYDSVLNSFEHILSQLKTDYLDLLLIHWPNKNIPMKETFDAFEFLVKNNKVKSIGVSNFTISHLKEAMKISKIPISVNQVEFHPYLFQSALLEFCNENNIKLEAYSPLAHGEILQEKLILSLAKKYSCSPSQISLAWLIEKGIIVIPKASSEEHLKQNIQSLEIKLSKSDIKSIDSLNKNQRTVNPAFSEF